MKNMWEWLEIEPTTDKKAIKKAYAAQVKKCHQEDEPERWQGLHDAYQQALKYAGRNATAGDKRRKEQSVIAKDMPNSRTMPLVKSEPQKQTRNNPKSQKVPPIEREQNSEMDAIFEDFAKHGEERKQVILEEIRVRMQYLTSKEETDNPEKWVAFLQSDVSMQMQTEQKYWSEFYSCLAQSELKIAVYQALLHELESIEIELGMQLSTESRRSFLKCKNLCKKKVEKDRDRKGWKGIFWIVVFMLFRILKVVIRHWDF